MHYDKNYYLRFYYGHSLLPGCDLTPHLLYLTLKFFVAFIIVSYSLHSTLSLIFVNFILFLSSFQQLPPFVLQTLNFKNSLFILSQSIFSKFCGLFFLFLMYIFSVMYNSPNGSANL